MCDPEKDKAVHPFHLEDGQVIFDPPPPQKEAAQEKRDREKHDFDREQVTTNKRIATFTGFLLLATACGISSSIWQGCISQKSAKAAEAGAKAAQRAAYESCRASQISRIALIESIQTGRDAHTSSVASTYQTIVAIKSEAAHLVPYIKGQAVSYQPGQTISAVIGLKNDGKTAASKIITKTFIELVGRDEDPPIRYSIKNSSMYVDTPKLEAGQEPSSFTDIGGLTTTIHKNGVFYIATEKDIKDIGLGRKHILFFARITYNDSLGVNHWINFCRSLPPIMVSEITDRVHEQCIHYNREDGNSAIPEASNYPPVAISVPEILCTDPDK